MTWSQYKARAERIAAAMPPDVAERYVEKAFRRWQIEQKATEAPRYEHHDAL